MLKLFEQHGVKASFQLSLGPDYSSHPLKILPWYLLSCVPAAKIGEQAKEQLKSILQESHEIGIGPFLPASWRRNAAYADEVFTRNDLMQSLEAFQHLFDSPPSFFGAVDWQVNPHLLKLEEELGFNHACDVRGKMAFLPSLQDVSSGCIQIPTTLPTINELLANPSVNEHNVHEFLFAVSQRVLPNGEVFCVNAEQEGIERLVIMERIIVMWKGSQWEFKTLGELVQSIGNDKPPWHQVGWAEVAGHAGHVAMQSLKVV
ncbi:deacylase [Solemya velesiana gill symbiont]|uniref:deacylase n=1 Tax=Solemya velesiana gill symbiont TaxID=1918948 RepID=UPI00108361AF|nr:deacylase [Solemya velesiana gill symbiont]